MSEPAVEASNGIRLLAVADLDESGVTTVETPHGRLAVGISKGRPFAVSDRCRHLFASLGKGRVAEDGCLECPWHKARYDPLGGGMVRGPQGAAFRPVRGAVRGYVNSVGKLKRYPVEERDGVLYLTAR
jgi:3-phenylpropionate/trans-cinnamate dioxygenase ferredoxin component